MKDVDLSVEKISLDLKILLPLFVIFLILLLGGGVLEISRIIFLLSTLMMGLLLWRKRRKLKVSKEFKIIFWLWVAYLIAHVLALVDGASLALSVPKTVEMMSVFIWFNYFYFNFQKKHLSLLIWFLLFVGVVLSLISFYFIAFPPPPNFPTSSLVYAFHGHNHLSDYLLLILPLSAVLWIKEKNKKTRWKFFGLLLFLLTSFFLTFARGAYVVLSLILVLILWIYKPTLKKTLFLGSIALLPLISLLGIMLFSHSRVASKINHTYEPNERLEWLWRQTIKPVDSEGRLDYWKQAWEGFKLRPVFGNGPGTFRLTSRRFQTRPDSWSRFAHSLILGSLSEIGIVGSIIFLSLVVLSLFYAKRNNLYTKMLWVGLLASVLHCSFDFDFDFIAILVLFWILLASMLVEERRKKNIHSLVVTSLTIVVSVYIGMLLGREILVLKQEYEKIHTEKQISKYHLQSVHVFPFDRQSWIDYFRANEKSEEFGELKKRAEFFNKEDGEMLIVIAKVLQENDTVAAKKMYEKIIVYDPTNLQNYLPLLTAEAEENMQLVFDYFREMAEVGIQKQRYSSPVSDTQLTLSFVFPKDNVKLKKDLIKFVYSLEDNNIFQPFIPNFAKVFYDLGLISYQHSEHDLALKFWQTAVSIAPKWSHFHIELANLYAYLKEDEFAYSQINSCMTFSSARKHCEDYYEDVVLKHGFQAPTSLKTKIDSIIN